MKELLVMLLKISLTWRDHTFELIDTGGISLRKSQDPIQEQVRQRAIEYDGRSRSSFICMRWYCRINQ